MAEKRGGGRKPTAQKPEDSHAGYTLDSRNARVHPEQNLASLGGSLRELGAGRSIVVDKNGVVIGGNAVLQKAMELGIPTIEVETDGSSLLVVKRIDLDTDDPKRKALALADNQIALLAEWDTPRLEELKAELGEIQLIDVGFVQPLEIPDPQIPGSGGGSGPENPGFLAGYRYFPVIIKEEDADLIQAWFDKVCGTGATDGMLRGIALLKWIREQGDDQG